MTSLVRSLFIATLLLAGLVHAEAPSTPTTPAIELQGFAKPFVLDEAALRALPRVDYTKTIRGEEGTWAGARLTDVLARAGAPAGEELRGTALTSVLRVQAADGHVVVFSPAEFDEAFGSNGALLTYERDGKALSIEEGPFRLLIPGDNRAERSMRRVTKIELRTID